LAWRNGVLRSPAQAFHEAPSPDRDDDKVTLNSFIIDKRPVANRLTMEFTAPNAEKPSMFVMYTAYNNRIDREIRVRPEGEEGFKVVHQASVDMGKRSVTVKENGPIPTEAAAWMKSWNITV
jgi:hypothetical protein